MDKFIFKKVYLPNLLILLLGVSAGYLASAAAIIFFFVYYRQNKYLTNIYLLLTLIIIMLLGDNYQGMLKFYQPLRYLIVILLSIYNVKGIINKSSKFLIPFVCFSSISTIFFLDFNLVAYFKILSYIVTAGSIFKCMQFLLNFDKEKTINYLAYLLLVFLIINILLLPFSSFYFAGRTRFLGLLAHPNGVATMICGSVPILIFSYESVFFKIKKSNFYLVVALILIMLILTGSRTCSLALVVFLLLKYISRFSITTIKSTPKIDFSAKINFLKKFKLLAVSVFKISYFDNKPRICAYRSGLIILTSILFLIAIELDLFSIDYILNLNFVKNLLRLDSINSGSGRFDIWLIAYNEILKNPIFGNGFTYDTTFIQEYGKAIYGENMPREYGGIWNSYLSLLLNTGVLGLLSFLFFLYKMWRYSINKKFATALLIMFLIIGLSESWMMATLNILFPLMIINWSLLQHKLIKRSIHV